MTFEFKQIVEAYKRANKSGLRSVLATVVALDGSSYRKPGVRMLILENGKIIGAVSGGCVEKDIKREAQSVFKTGKAKMMTYDGRYRLGCEGVLYILIELFQPDLDCLETLNSHLKSRKPFSIKSYYKKQQGIFAGIGSIIKFENGINKLSNFVVAEQSRSIFSEILPPCFKLMIFGAEHDAVALCQLANFNGWEVTVVSGPLESKTISDFPGATAFYSVSPDALEFNSIDDETAVVIMSHNYANDLKYLIELKDSQPSYIGLLGPKKRREKLLSDLLEYCPNIDDKFVERIHGPAGLNIGAETPQEIAISIISEILSEVRNQTPIPLKVKQDGIHS
ncbi:XdhC family protein [Hanstruepera marina]|uniref:XdhC family protein n=1 Tax=Hanstruepera marina TaxID=2873265 RepID=UPI001CA719B7|nr:XdhC/CoxI family protein [Hanstruepera marina]